MLEGFLERSKAVRRLRVGIFGPFVDSFISDAVAAGFSDATIRMQLWILERFQAWLVRRGHAVTELSPDVVAEFVKASRRRRKRRGMSRPAGGEGSTLQHFLRHLESSGAISLLSPPEKMSATEQILDRFGIFLKCERGLSPKTVQRYASFARRLLLARFKSSEPNLSRLTPGDISRFITRHAASMVPKEAQLMTSALRAFFRFLLQYGEINQDLAAVVPTVADWRRAQVPHFITQTQVRAMLETCDRSTTCGRRNYALLLILARLGLRASEVMNLRLTDIDWRAGEITVHGKGKLVDRLPLPQDVGEALAEYLQHGRPKCKVTEVFVRDRAPHRRFANASCVSSIVRRALHRAGFVDLPKFGAQLLRSSLATAMLHDGASMSEIGEVLRHRSPNTTELYVKVDFEGLRSLAQPWPVHGGAR